VDGAESLVRTLVASGVSVDFQVLDLTDKETRSHVSVDEADLVSDDYATTQAIAAAARDAGFDAVLAPAAAPSPPWRAVRYLNNRTVVGSAT
jgi:RES domain-containing protein